MAGLLVPEAPATLQQFGTRTRGADEAILLLHGFPGEINQQNQDLARKLAHEMKIPAYVLHYRGLGLARGQFSFQYSIEEAVKTAKYLLDIQGYKRLSLLGHSWGGFVALNVLREIGQKIGRVVLLSPLTQMLSPEQARQIVTHFTEQRPGFFLANSIQEVCAEIEHLRATQEPKRFINKLQIAHDQLFLIQALNDEEVPPQVNRDFAAVSENKVHYLEIQQGHTFLEDRDSLLKLIIEGLSGRYGNFR